MSSILIYRIARTAGNYDQAVRDLMDAGLGFDKAARAARAAWFDTIEGRLVPRPAN